MDRVIETESRQVLERHARKDRTAAWKAGLFISVLLLIPVILMTGVWLVFLTARYLPANTWIKAGLISLITGIWMAFSSDAYGLIAEHKRQLTILAADFSDWTSAWSINANTYLLFLAAGILLGILCIAIGVTRGRK